jgi:hypothetical protein
MVTHLVGCPSRSLSKTSHVWSSSRTTGPHHRRSQQPGGSWSTGVRIFFWVAWHGAVVAGILEGRSASAANQVARRARPKIVLCHRDRFVNDECRAAGIGEQMSHQHRLEDGEYLAAIPSSLSRSKLISSSYRACARSAPRGESHVSSAVIGSIRGQIGDIN